MLLSRNACSFSPLSGVWQTACDTEWENSGQQHSWSREKLQSNSKLPQLYLEYHKLCILCPSGFFSKWYHKGRSGSWNGNLTWNTDFPSRDGIEPSVSTTALQKLCFACQ